MSRESIDSGQRNGVMSRPSREESRRESSRTRREASTARREASTTRRDASRTRRDSPMASSSTEASPHSQDTHKETKAEQVLDDDIKLQYAERCARFFAAPEDTITPFEVDTPYTAPPLEALLPPLLEIPQAPNSAPVPPPKAIKLPSPVLDVVSTPSTVNTEKSESVSPQTPGLVVALPGTMSSRRDRSRSHSRPAPRRRTVPRKQPFVSRWRSKVIGMFSHAPPDQTDLERIPDRHWADEDF